MKVEFINYGLAKRKKFFYALCLIIIILLFVTLFKYFLPPDYEHHQHYGYHHRHSILDIFDLFTYTQFLAIPVLTTLIGIPLIFYSKIVQLISVDTEHDFFKVEYVGRFRLRPVTKTAKLSETRIQIERPDFHQSNYRDKTYFSIHMRHKNFGYLKISARDFKNIKQICDQFQLLNAKNYFG
jgi:hypothetical protein